MLKKTEFRWDQLGSLDTAEQKQLPRALEQKTDTGHVSSPSAFLQNRTRKQQNETEQTTT